MEVERRVGVKEEGGRDKEWELKVDGNEKNGGSGRSQMIDNGLGPWRSRFVYNLNMQLLSKMSYFRFACNKKMNRRLLCN
jgi:hypothetical protein